MKDRSDQSSPRVSVIIPNYNHGAFLSARIESVLNQSFQDFEIILLDDCSADNSKDVIAKYSAHPKVAQVILNEANSGSGFKQWKKGIELARGELVWIAESDDISADNFLETMVAELDRQKDLAIIFCKSAIIDDKGNRLRDYEFSFDGNINSQKSWVVSGKEFCARYFCRYNVLVNASSVMFRRELYLKTGGVKTEFRICSDWLLWWDMLAYGNIAFLPDVLNYYRLHHHNTSAKWESELAVVYEYCLAHWPAGTDKNSFRTHIVDYASKMYAKRKPNHAWTVSRTAGFFIALQLWFRAKVWKK